MKAIKKPLLPGIALFLALASLLAGGKFPYMFFYLTVLAFLIPYVGLKRSLAKLTGDIQVSTGYGEVGHSLTVDYRVQNSPGGRFPYLELTDMTGEDGGGDEGRLISLEGGETVHIKRQVRFTRRGIYDVKSLRVETGDPFGFFKLGKSLAAGKKIKVYPRLRAFPEITLPARQHFGDLAVRDRQFENYSQVEDLRQWHQGDSIKRVHWKQSARQEQLVVKNFALKGDASLNIFVDMGAASYSHDRGHMLEDLAVEAAASFVYFNLRQNIPLQVFSQGLSGGGLQGRHLRDYREIMDSLITLSPRRPSDFAAYINTQSYYLTPKSSLYLITPSLSLPEAAVFLGLKQRGFSPALFYLAIARLPDDEVALVEKVKEAGIKAHLLHVWGGD